MIQIVELLPDEEFADIGKLKTFYLNVLTGGLNTMGYAVTPIDLSELYSFERMILLETNAPGAVVDSILRNHNLLKRGNGLCVRVA